MQPFAHSALAHRDGAEREVVQQRHLDVRREDRRPERDRVSALSPPVPARGDLTN
jgi:hypothetical protein